MDLTKPPLLKGLAGLSQAIQWNRMSGHPPAAVIAAHYFCQENQLDKQVQAAVQAVVELMASGTQSIWYRPAGGPVTNAELFSTIPEADPVPAAIPRIAAALADSIDACRDSGHNTIFASLALKALHDAPEYAYPAIIDGIVKLLEDFRGRGPGYAHIPGVEGVVDARRIPINPDIHLSPYATMVDMIAATCQFVIPENFGKRGVGGPIHVVDHTVALLDLAALGYPALALRGLAAHHQHLQIWLSLPDFHDSGGTNQAACQRNPLSEDYWTNGVRLKDQGGYEHRLKFLYGTYRFQEHIKMEADRRAFMNTAAYLY